ncbi:phospholipase A2 inhibitor beta-like [Neodiprion fabricii]|uniref:phospholipase A2 inhibitor beta-like n=1 Tax=Neodiprion fabricii TaxID=2872261 RepID=UPI001ED92E77|nr:phospholipase A2 inhibitor beta-like [Neodiprion fabricii]
MSRKRSLLRLDICIWKRYSPISIIEPCLVTKENKIIVTTTIHRTSHEIFVLGRSSQIAKKRVWNMDRKIIFSTLLHVLGTVCHSSSADTPENALVPRTEIVENGRLADNWSDKLPHSTEDVDLSGLGLETVKLTTFAKFDELNAVNLSSNKLSSTSEIAIAVQRVKPLTLDLSHNNLGLTLYRENTLFLFDAIKYFWSINLSHNRVHGLEIDFDVVHLNLSNNEIKCHNRIKRHRFHSDEIYVATLDLSHNLINCQSKLFSVHISKLDMSYNKLDGIGPELFEGLRGLVELNITHNNIRYIHPRAFVNKTYMTKLNLRSNHLRNVYSLVFRSTYSLRFVDLSANRLTYTHWYDAYPQLENTSSTEVGVYVLDERHNRYPFITEDIN